MSKSALFRSIFLFQFLCRSMRTNLMIDPANDTEYLFKSGLFDFATKSVILISTFTKSLWWVSNSSSSLIFQAVLAVVTAILNQNVWRRMQLLLFEGCYLQLCT